MADEKTMELSHSELADLLLDGYDRIVRHLYQDFLSMTGKGKTEQTTEACASEDREGEVLDDSNLDLSHADSPPEAGPDERVLTDDSKDTAMRTDVPCPGTAQTVHRSAEASVEVFECGKHLAGVYAGYGDIPLLLIPQSILMTSDSPAGRNKSVSVDKRWPVVIKGVTTVVFPNVAESQSPVYLPKFGV
jgi:hypothetical protein